MPANRDKKTGKWNCQFYYTDWTGKKVKKMKRGFETKKEAQNWERHFKLDILFRSKDVEKSGTGFQRVNDFCKKQNVTWNYRKEAYGFFFEFIRTNVQINVQINAELTEAHELSTIQTRRVVP